MYTRLFFTVATRCVTQSLIRNLTWGFASALIVSACHMPEGTVIPPIEGSSTAYWSLRVNHRAVTLSLHSPWDTVQLTAVPLSADEDTLDAPGAIRTFESQDSGTVMVTSQGFVRAKATTNGTRIFVKLTVGRSTYIDTVWVKVVDNPAPKWLDSISIQPPPSDSAKRAVDYVDSWPGAAYLATFASDGTSMTEILVDWKSLDPEIKTVDQRSGMMQPNRNDGYGVKLGTLRIVASAYAYGVSRTDTLYLTLGYPLFFQADFTSCPRKDGLGFETCLELNARPFDLKNPRLVGVGAEMLVQNITSDPVNLVFDDTTHIEAIYGAPGEPINTEVPGADPDDPWAMGGYAFRKFLRPGEYVFRDTRTNTVGIIRVIDERVVSRAEHRHLVPTTATQQSRRHVLP